MKIFNLLALIAVFGLSACNSTQKRMENLAVNNPEQKEMSFYDLKAKTIDGENFDFSSLKGKKVLIVNVASECGFTGQYKPLQELYDAYSDKNFTIIGFPCNDFGGQEPGSEESIKGFCEKNYGVSFPLMAKVNIKKTPQSPIYTWLTSKVSNGVADHSVRWNFHKFLIDENGILVASHGSSVNPMSEEIISFVEGKN
jgi:glutathione peroxidase